MNTSLWPNKFILRVCFGRVDFREDEKKKKRREKMSWEKFSKSVGLGEGERKMMVGLKCFLPRPIKKYAHVHLHIVSRLKPKRV